MKTGNLMLVPAAIVCVLAFNVQSDEPAETHVRPTLLTSPLGQELIDTLELALNQRLAEYESGRCGPEHGLETGADADHRQEALRATDFRCEQPFSTHRRRAIR